MTSPTLSTVKVFVAENPSFTEGGIRHQIFHEKENGLAEAKAIVRVGRKVLIHEEKYFEWLLGEKPATSNK